MNTRLQHNLVLLIYEFISHSQHKPYRTWLILSIVAICFPHPANAQSYDLNGEWIGTGYNPGAYENKVRIRQVGNNVQAIKITGTSYIPAGQITWYGRLTSSNPFHGKIQIADRDYTNPRWADIEIRIIDDDHLIVTLVGDDPNTGRRDWGPVRFERIKPRTENPPRPRSDRDSAKRNIWVYSADPTRTLQSQPDSRLQDFIIVLEKTRITTSVPKYRYTISILGDNLKELRAALLAMIVSEDMDVDVNSLRSLVHRNVPGRGILQNIQSRTDSGWEEASVQQPRIEWGDKVARVVRDVLGFIPVVGRGIGIGEGAADVYALFKEADDILPSASFSGKLRNTNHYDVYNFGAVKLRPAFIVSGSLVYGVRCEAIVDETNGQPIFFLKVKNSRNKFIGVELWEDRRLPTITSSN